MKSILVTGASGFVGQHVLPILIKQNFKVHALYTRHLPMIHPNVMWHQIDLHNQSSVTTLLQKINVSHLLHLAWYAKPNEYWTSPLNIEWLISSIHLLKAFSEAKGQRAVLIGTCAEYDWQSGHCHEFITPCLPKTLYGRTKYSLFLLSEMIAKQQNISLAWARLFFLFGPYESKQRLIPSAICNFLNNQQFIVRNGEQTRDFMYVEDVAAALVSLLQSNRLGPVNIASGCKIKIKTLIGLLSKKLKSEHLLQYIDKEEIQDPIVTAEIKRLAEEVNWCPLYTLDHALDKTISWWRDNN